MAFGMALRIFVVVLVFALVHFSEAKTINKREIQEPGVGEGESYYDLKRSASYPKFPSFPTDQEEEEVEEQEVITVPPKTQKPFFKYEQEPQIVPLRPSDKYEIEPQVENEYETEKPKKWYHHVGGFLKDNYNWVKNKIKEYQATPSEKYDEQEDDKYYSKGLGRSQSDANYTYTPQPKKWYHHVGGFINDVQNGYDWLKNRFARREADYYVNS